MIIHCYKCGKAVSSKLDHCPYCKIGFLENKPQSVAKFQFFRKLILSLRSLFF